jgi:hypothetical protein
MGFLNELVQVPVWFFGFVALGLFAAVYASNKLNKLNSQDW